MAPIHFEEDRRELPTFTAHNTEKGRKAVKELSVSEVPVKGNWNKLRVFRS